MWPPKGTNGCEITSVEPLSVKIAPKLWPVAVTKKLTDRKTDMSRVCAVAQYAVLEANGRGQFSHPTPPKPLNQFRCHVKYITTSPRELMCKIWLESIRPLRICACVKKTRFVWIFFINISICPSVSSSGLQVTVLWQFLRLMAQTTSFRNH